VFVSFDPEHDEHLYELLLEESRSAASGFEVLGCSARSTDAGLWSGRLREEIRIAREERKPHILLWGRREIMCSKPIGAKPAEGMYSWTPEILQERITYLRRIDWPAEAPA
jgi:hypothetical protein